MRQALQALDALLDVRWNPHALILEPPRLDVYGRGIPARYDGRWEVVRRMTDKAYEDDGDKKRVVYQVRGPDSEYKPLGMWLVEYMQRWDSQQRHFRDEMEKVRRAEELAEQQAMEVDVGAVEHGVHQLAFAVKHEGGRSVYFGQGTDYAAMAERAKRALSPPNGEPALIPQRV